MKNKILISLLATTILSAGLLTGCGEEYVDTGLSGSIKLYSSIANGDLAKYEKEIADEYMKINRNVQIEIVPVSQSDMEATVLADLSANTLPDAYYSDQALAATMEYKGLAVDNALYASKFFTQTYTGGVLGGVTVNDNLIMIPMSADPVVLIFRSDWLSEKTSFDTIETFAELKRAANILTSDGKYGIGLIGKNDPQGYSVFMSYLKSFGINEAFKASHGNWDSDFYTDQFAIALQEFYDLAITRGYSPNRMSQTGYAETLLDFSSETTAMVFVKYSDIYKILEVNPDLEGKIGVATVPRAEAETTIANFEGYVVCETSKNKSLVNDYLAFMASHETLKDAIGYKLPLESNLIANDERYRDDFSKVALRSVVIAADPPVFPNTNGIYAIAMETFNSMVDFGLSASDLTPRAVGDTKTFIAKNT